MTLHAACAEQVVAVGRAEVAHVCHREAVGGSADVCEEGCGVVGVGLLGEDCQRGLGPRARQGWSDRRPHKDPHRESQRDSAERDPASASAGQGKRYVGGLLFGGREIVLRTLVTGLGAVGLSRSPRFEACKCGEIGLCRVARVGSASNALILGVIAHCHAPLWGSSRGSAALALGDERNSLTDEIQAPELLSQGDIAPSPRTAVARSLVLDVLRIFAARWVVVFHSANLTSTLPDWLHNFFKVGYMGVDIFFILSGAVIIHTAVGRTWSTFAQNRFLRLFPVYIGATALVLVFQMLADGTFHPGPETWLGLTGVQFWLGIDPIIGAAWTLRYEVGFYFLIAVLIIVARNNVTERIVRNAGAQRRGAAPDGRSNANPTHSITPPA